MHYTKTLRLRLLWVFGLNATIGLFIAISLWWLQSDGNAHSLPAHLADSFLHSSIYGTIFGLGMPYLAERLGTFRTPWNWISILVSVALLSVLATAAVQMSLLGSGLIRAERFWPEYGYKSASVFLIALVIALCVWGYERFRDQMEATNLQLRTQQLEKERVLKLLTDARLKNLESRLRPHFLFNTLNSIAALISENPNLAEEMLQRLASLLRTSLDTHAGSCISLRDEIKLMKDYAEIEKVRLGERLTLSIDVRPELEPLAVLPMTLQPLVENSIKYVISPRIQGGKIRVSAREETGQLILSVWDDGPGFAIEEIAADHSIDNLRARLRSLLGQTTSVSVLSHNDGSAVTITLPARNSITA